MRLVVESAFICCVWWVIETCSAFTRRIDLIIQIEELPEMSSNLMEQQAARAAAKRLFQKVNFSGGPLQSYEISSLMTDTYEYLKIPFKPNSIDISKYTEVLDANGDGQVTLADIETLAVRYLCGPGVIEGAGQKEKYGGDTTAYSHSYQQSSAASERNIGLANGHSQSYSQQKSVGQVQASGHGESSGRSGYSAQQQVGQPAQREYNQQTMQYIAMIKQIFERHATQYSTITVAEVGGLLAETYDVLGQKGYEASEQDGQVWVRLCDPNEDGHVQFQQYCYFVLRQLEEAGYEIYK